MEYDITDDDEVETEESIAVTPPRRTSGNILVQVSE
jgi:hypothetical protein